VKVFQSWGAAGVNRGSKWMLKTNWGVIAESKLESFHKKSILGVGALVFMECLKASKKVICGCTGLSVVNVRKGDAL
jgi:hypothetical protein